MKMMIKAMCYICGKLINEGDRFTLYEYAYDEHTHQTVPMTISGVLSSDVWNTIVTSVSQQNSAIKHKGCEHKMEMEPRP